MVKKFLFFLPVLFFAIAISPFYFFESYRLMGHNFGWNLYVIFFGLVLAIFLLASLTSDFIFWGFILFLFSFPIWQFFCLGQYKINIGLLLVILPGIFLGFREKIFLKKINFSLPLKLLFIFQAVILIAFLRVINLWSYSYVIDNILLWFGFVIFFILIGSLNKKAVALGRLFNFLIFLGVLASLVGMAQHFNVFGLNNLASFEKFSVKLFYIRSYGTFFHPHAFADYLGVVLIAALVNFFWADKEGFWLKFYLISAVLIFGGLLSTLSRSGLGAFIFTLVMMIFFIRKKVKFFGYKIILLFLPVLILTLPFVITQAWPSRIMGINFSGIEKFTVLNQKPLPDDPNYDLAQRITAYKTALANIKNNLIFGLGSGVLWHSHNLFLQLWLDNGFFGLLLFFLIMFRYFRFSFKIIKKGDDQQNKLVLISVFCSLFLLVKGLTDLIFLLPLWGFLMGVSYNFLTVQKPPVYFGKVEK